MGSVVYTLYNRPDKSGGIRSVFLSLEDVENSVDNINNTHKVKWSIYNSNTNTNANYYDTYLKVELNNKEIFKTNYETDYFLGGYSGWITYRTNWANYGNNIAKLGYVASGTETVKHDSSGKAIINIKCACGVYYYTVYTYNLDWESKIKTDTTSPEVVQNNIKNIGTDSFVISAYSSDKCKNFEYSFDNKNWLSITTETINPNTTVEKTISGLSANKEYTIYIRAIKVSNNIYGYSQSKSAKTLGASHINSISDYTLGDDNSVDINYTSYDRKFDNLITLSLGNYVVSVTRNVSGMQIESIPLSASKVCDLYKQYGKDGKILGKITLVTKSNGVQIGSTSTEEFIINIKNEDDLYPYLSIDGYVGVRSGSTLLEPGEPIQLLNVKSSGKYNSSVNISVKIQGDLLSETITNANPVLNKITTNNTCYLVITSVDDRGYSTMKTLLVEVAAQGKIALAEDDWNRWRTSIENHFGIKDFKDKPIINGDFNLPEEFVGDIIDESIIMNDDNGLKKNLLPFIGVSPYYDSVQSDIESIIDMEIKDEDLISSKDHYNTINKTMLMLDNIVIFNLKKKK